MKHQRFLQFLFTSLLAAIVLTVFGVDPVAVYPLSLGLGLLSYFVVVPGPVLGEGVLVTPKSMREEAGRVLKKMEDLSKKEKFDVKEAEQLMEEHDQLIAKAELIEKTIRINAENSNKKGNYTILGEDNSLSRMNDKAWFDKKGAEIRIIGPDESFHTGERAPLSFGGFIQSIARGTGITEAEKRALAEGSDGAGGYTVPEILMTEWIDKLRAKTTVIQAGARNITLGSDSNTMAKLTGDASAGWIAENGLISENDMTFSNVEFTPKKLIGLVVSSRELIEDSINVREMIERSFAETMALKLDEAALLGTGENVPAGIDSYSNLAVNYLMGEAGAGDPLENYIPFIKLIRYLKAANAGLPTAFIMSPRSWEQLALLVDTTGQPLILPKALENIQFFDTSAIPENLGTGENESVIFGGNFSDLVIGIRNSMKIEVLKERFASNYQYGFLAAIRADIKPLHEQSFAKITKILP